MSVVAPTAAEELVASWLTSDQPIDGGEHPAGPLYSPGYEELEITMTGPGPGPGPGMTMDIITCTGGYDPVSGQWYQCL